MGSSECDDKRLILLAAARGDRNRSQGGDSSGRSAERQFSASARGAKVLHPSSGHHPERTTGSSKKPAFGTDTCGPRSSSRQLQRLLTRHTTSRCPVRRGR
jgi:hypothetical protein